ncbi:MAG: hypothetical protein ACI9WU_003198, partial [Myxococcota bacterium]
TRPMLVASRLRIAMERRGFAAVPKGEPMPDDGFTLAIRRTGPADCWIHPDHPDAVPDELAQLLSSELRCRVTSIAQMGTVCAYEVADSGTIAEKLAADGSKILESTQGRFEARVAGGESLNALVLEAGWDGLSVSFAEACETRRAMVIGFAPLPGRHSAEEIVIDPGLSCPVCGQAMRTVEGRFGAFFGCVRFPTCQGRFSEKEAEKVRTT